MLRDRMVWMCVAGIVITGGASARGQIGDQRSETVSFVMDSGVHDNASPFTELVFQQAVDFGDVAWFRLLFDGAFLDVGSYVRITSFADGVVQELDAVTFGEWKGSSAFFNGGSGRLALYAGAGTTGNFFRTREAIVGAPPGPIPETLCSGTDDRVTDTRNGIARMVTLSLNGPCSGTIVTAAGCLFSAGHCVGTFGIAQFNVPSSNANGTMQHPGVEDQYIVDPSSIVFTNGGQGNDYGYFTCFPNTQTGLTAVEAEGVFYPLASELPPVGTILRVTGFGLDNGADNNTQQTDVGEYVGNAGHTIHHRVDTTGGNSGSSVVIDATDEVIGIHTHGGCDVGPETFNSGTAITHPALQPELICCDPPLIETQPVDVMACLGDTVSLSVTVGGGGVLGLQWRQDGVDIPGATSDTLVIDPLTESDNGVYDCVVMGCVEAVSNAATVTAVSDIEITSQPVDVTHDVGDNVFLSVAAAGGTLSFQWRKGGVDIPGAESFFLVLSNAQCEDAGVYDVMLGNECEDTAVSNPATVTIVPCAVDGDGDGDGDVDLLDFQMFVACAAGPGQPVSPACAVFNFDGDTDVDRHDFAAFQLVHTGS